MDERITNESLMVIKNLKQDHELNLEEVSILLFIFLSFNFSLIYFHLLEKRKKLIILSPLRHLIFL